MIDNNGFSGIQLNLGFGVIPFEGHGLLCAPVLISFGKIYAPKLSIFSVISSLKNKISSVIL